MNWNERASKDRKPDSVWATEKLKLKKIFLF